VHVHVSGSGRDVWRNGVENGGNGAPFLNSFLPPDRRAADPPPPIDAAALNADRR
jgi:hypothetical protein